MFRKIQNISSFEIIKFLITFNFVGFIGFVVPITKPLFIQITPFALLLCFVAILYFQKQYWSKKSFIIFLIIFMCGYAIEVVGVTTGYIFGVYWYATALGPKMLETPLMIGVNWVMLCYLTASIVAKYVSYAFLRVVLASILMVSYDLFLEQSASKLEMWFWENNIIPIQNYIAWFFIALVFQSIIVLSKVVVTNRYAFTLFACQFVFFVLLFLFL